MKRMVLAMLLGIAVLALPVPALAGGWTVVTLDTLPDQIAPGEPLTVGFTVRQHGTHPLDGLEPFVTATNTKSSKTLRVTAPHDGAPGHYIATLTFPSAGDWTWEVHSKPFPPVVMPLLSVGASQAIVSSSAMPPTGLATSSTAPATLGASLPWLWAAIASTAVALVCLTAGGLLVLRNGRVPAVRRHEA